MSEPAKPFAGVTGLTNLGNTCYMNAAIQALSNCSPFSFQFVDSAAYATSKQVCVELLGREFDEKGCDLLTRRRMPLSRASRLC